MRSKVYLSSPPFIVSHPQQDWGNRQEQLLLINRVSVNYSTLMYNFPHVLDMLLENRSMQGGFGYWNELLGAINNFMNDVELHYPLVNIMRGGHADGYMADIENDDDIERGNFTFRMG